MKICANCQTQCEDTMNFCSNCGAALEGAIAEEVIPEETIPEEVIPEEAISEEAVSEEAVKEDVVSEDVVPEEAAEETAETLKKETFDTPQTQDEQPVLTIEEDTSTVAIPEPQIRDAGEAAEESITAGAAAIGAAAAAEAAKEPAVQKKAPVKKKKSKKKKPMSVMAVLSMIFSLIGLFSGGYACLFTFADLMTAAIFFVPSLLGIVFGIIGIAVSGKYKAKRGRPLAVFGLIIGVLSLALWIVGAYYLHNMVREKYGTEDLMSAVRAILSGR